MKKYYIYLTFFERKFSLFGGKVSKKGVRVLKKRYNYRYDALNRIESALGNVNRYDLINIDYDKNGNIQKLKRNGHRNSAYTSFGVMDDLDYNYYPNSNKLQSVQELSGGHNTYGFKNGSTASIEYVYDANGNMMQDLNKSIGANGISYNHLNLPTQVTINSQNISYVYNAIGGKIRKTVGSTTTDYAGNFVYENDNLQFFNTPEGYSAPVDVANYNSGFNYIYQYKDHLGNIRLSYADNNGNLEIIEENNYYPFGLKHRGYNDSGASSLGNNAAQRYKFGGNELQDEIVGGSSLQWYDITARNYDPTLGRWMNLDPLAEQMRRHSPYNYAFNSPVFFVDPDGMMPVGTDPPEKLYHNTTSSNAATIQKEGFNASKTGRFSKYNWFSTTANAGGTGVQGADATLSAEGIDVSNAQTISNKQLKGFYNAAKEELGYTSEQIKTDPKIAKEVNSLKFKKMGDFMNSGGADVYKVGNSYAVTDDVANGASKLTKTLNKIKGGLRINLGALEAAELPLMLLEYHQIDMATTFNPNYKGLGNAEQFNYQQFGVKTPGKKLQKSSFWTTLQKGLKAMSNQQ